MNSFNIVNPCCYNCIILNWWEDRPRPRTYSEESSWFSSSTSHYSPSSLSWGSAKNKSISKKKAAKEPLVRSTKTRKMPIHLRITRKVKNTSLNSSTRQLSSDLSSSKMPLVCKKCYMGFTTIVLTLYCFHSISWLEHQNHSLLLYFSSSPSASCSLTLPNCTER